MIHIRRDSTVYELLTFFAYVGEFPYAAIPLLGGYDTNRKAIYKMSKDQQFRIPNHDQVISGRLLNISGSKKQKTIRLSQVGVTVLEMVNPEAGAYYAQVYGKTRISSSAERVDRAHRMAETVALFRLAGVETCPSKLPPIQVDVFIDSPPDEPLFYPSQELKHIESDSVSLRLIPWAISSARRAAVSVSVGISFSEGWAPATTRTNSPLGGDWV